MDSESKVFSYHLRWITPYNTLLTSLKESFAICGCLQIPVYHSLLSVTHLYTQTIKFLYVLDFDLLQLVVSAFLLLSFTSLSKNSFIFLSESVTNSVVNVSYVVKITVIKKKKHFTNCAKLISSSKAIFYKELFNIE